MPLFKDRDDGEPVAHVRYVEFSNRERGGQSLFSAPKLQRKSVSGPSGHQYAFRQQGRSSNSRSQWLPIRSTEDAEYFEERDSFEVRRDEP